MPAFDELDAEGNTVLVRVDVNAPIDPASGRLLDDERIREHLGTLRRLSDAAVVLISHQSRPGKNDFTTLEQHATRLDRLLDRPVRYVDDVFGPAARDAIRDVAPGEVLVLENVRFYSEEYIEMPPEEAADTHLVQRLAPLFDAYVDDAFSAAHRSQPSLVGFPERLPSYPGPLMERELEVLEDVGGGPSPVVFALGGAKVEDAVAVIANAVEHDVADTILLSGVVGNVFLEADGRDVGGATHEYVRNQGYGDVVERAETLLDAHPDVFELPSDVAVAIDGERQEAGVEEFPVDALASDIGVETIARYEAVLEEAGTAVVNGPPGIYEEALFQLGTREVFSAATRAEFSVSCGGDTAAAVDALDVRGFDHVSIGGGASTTLLSGDTLPAVEALRDGG